MAVSLEARVPLLDRRVVEFSWRLRRHHKVRDGRGAFSWIEAARLTDRRAVMVKVPLADVRAQPDDAAPVVFQAQENVLLDVVGVSGSWVQVRHRDGASGLLVTTASGARDCSARRTSCTPA